MKTRISVNYVQGEPCALALVTLTALGVLAIALRLTALTLQGLAHVSDASPADMSALYAEWQACMASEDRASECMLEYDGNGDSNTPADWHWYWRKQHSKVLKPDEVTLLWENK